jgi:hypothetical protein
MRWILRSWFLAGGVRSFLAGYIGGPLLVGLVIALVARSFLTALVVIPGTVMACLGAPLGLIAALLSGVPAWGPWDGRLVFIGLLAGVAVLMAAGRRLDRRTVVASDGDPMLQVPAARVVTTAWNQLVGCWKQLVGATLLVVAGAGVSCLGCVGFAALAMA